MAEQIVLYLNLQAVILRFLSVTRLDDVGALVDDNLFERDILIATKRLGSSPNITERTQGKKPAPQSPSDNFTVARAPSDLEGGGVTFLSEKIT